MQPLVRVQVNDNPVVHRLIVVIRRRGRPRAAALRRRVAVSGAACSTPQYTIRPGYCLLTLTKDACRSPKHPSWHALMLSISVMHRVHKTLHERANESALNLLASDTQHSLFSPTT